MKVGIALKPNTPASAVFPFGDSVDLILVMTVEPGFGGQSFMENMMPKVEEIRAKYPGKDIEVEPPTPNHEA
jgi:ribulose-phosphate 3-epimerase